LQVVVRGSSGTRHTDFGTLYGARCSRAYAVTCSAGTLPVDGRAHPLSPPLVVDGEDGDVGDAGQPLQHLLTSSG
jgi:hypothetical protein